MDHTLPHSPRWFRWIVPWPHLALVPLWPHLPVLSHLLSGGVALRMLFHSVGPLFSEPHALLLAGSFWSCRPGLKYFYLEESFPDHPTELLISFLPLLHLHWTITSRRTEERRGERRWCSEEGKNRRQEEGWRKRRGDGGVVRIKWVNIH